MLKWMVVHLLVDTIVLVDGCRLRLGHTVNYVDGEMSSYHRDGSSMNIVLIARWIE